MIATENSLLMATNGADTSIPALNYGIGLAGLINSPVTLLGIVEKPGQRSAVEYCIGAAEEKMTAAQIPFRVHLHTGNSRRVVCEQAVSGKHLTVIGPLGRPLLRRWIRGRSYRRILAEINTPLLYVKNEQASLQNILVCMGGLGYARSAEQWAIYLAGQAGASLTILHVVEPVTYHYPIAQEIQNHWEDILETDTPLGRNLNDALKAAQAAGIPATFHVRKGSILHEIAVELNREAYDLVVMGSPHSVQSLRHLFMPNVTAEVAESVPCPVLCVKFGQDLIFERTV